MGQDRLKVAIVTGAAGGMGAVISRALVADGYRTVIADKHEGALSKLAVELGESALPQAFDIADPNAVDAAFEEIHERFGPASVLVNNAGILSNNKAVETTPDEWQRVMAVNINGAFYMSRKCLPAMRENGWGRIVNLCSLGIRTGGLTAGTAYVASKGAMATLTLSLARESAAHGITVNGLAPGYVMTPMVSEQLSDEQREALLEEIPVGRFCSPEEIAHVVRFLLSPLSGFITGEIIDINGGIHMD